MPIKKYHLMFDEIPEEVLTLVRDAIKKGLFKKEKEVKDKLMILGNLSDSLCSYYHIPNCKIFIIDEKSTSKSFGELFAPCYIKENKAIYLNKLSLVSFLHEFYHHLNFNSAIYVEDEHSPRGWSHSVFYLASPKLFENALNKNLLIWEKLEPREEPEGENNEL